MLYLATEKDCVFGVMISTTTVKHLDMFKHQDMDELAKVAIKSCIVNEIE